MSSLPNDYARCWDEKCIHRHRCKRSLGRHDDGARNFILSCQGSPEQQAQEDWIPYPLLIPVEQVSGPETSSPHEPPL